MASSCVADISVPCAHRISANYLRRPRCPDRVRNTSRFHRRSLRHPLPGSHRPAWRNSVRTLCFAQGVPASVIDTYEFPTTATEGLTQGNPDLKPETANTFNFGFSWQSRADSPLLSNITASIDYFNIKITDVISVVPGLTALSKCYNLDGSNPSYSPSNPFCALLERDSNGLLQIINTPYFNWAASRRMVWICNLDGMRHSRIWVWASYPAEYLSIPTSASRLNMPCKPYRERHLQILREQIPSHPAQRQPAAFRGGRA